MAENRIVKLNQLYLQFCEGKFDRREFMTRASALGISAASLSVFFRAIPASAQGTPAAGGTALQSITREEYFAGLAEQFPFTADQGAESTGGTIILGEIASSNLTTVNTMFANNSPTQPVMLLVHETLLASSPIDGQYVPGLADSWEIAEDGKTYTFHLHPGVLWHDGQPFTADDVIFSLDAMADEATGTQYTTSFNDTVASYSKIDDATIQLVASDIFAQVVFLGNSWCPMVPKHVWDGIPHDQWQADPGSTGTDASRVVGTGPHKFREINEGEGTTTFDANKDYYDVTPAYDTFIFQVWPDETSAIEALRAGDIDFYEGPPPADLDSLRAEPHLQVDLYDSRSFTWYGYQLDPEKSTLFQDVKTRRALFYALDRESMVANIMLGVAEVAQGTQPTLSVAYAPDRITTKYNYDPEMAKSLLAEAGWADSDGDGVVELNGQKFSFEIMYGSGSATSDQLAAAMQEYWKAVGVEATPLPVDFDTVLVPALVENFDFDVCFLGFNWDATDDQKAMFHTDYHGTGFNAMKYSNPPLDASFEQADREIDPEKRRELLIEQANVVNEDLPVGVLWFRKSRTAYNKRMHNYVPNELAGYLWSIPWVWVEQ